MLNTTYTVSYGSVPTNLTYSNKTQLDGLAVEFTGPSPTGDLNGRSTLTVSHNRTKQGIVRSLLSIRTPQYSGGTPNVQQGFTKVDIIINRAADLPLVKVTDEIDKIIDLLGEATIKTALSEAGV